ncbi:hypothetical protein CYMTET_42481 [Cymbomonas tetramitiformis]|uniref:Sugar transporter SWEET1 n=1 Tax=Cymbomonas tetramitiformis TaxID=36881 RepID=A0AAE0C5S3_9CHLO|nr:hypothetical protein CYMTET_42481 [Cymbomonas tetramitiformis]
MFGALGFLKTCATLSAMALFTSGMDTIRIIKANQSCGSFSSFPFASTCLNCLIWTLYGILLKSYVPLVVTNLYGSVFSAFCLWSYSQYANLEQRSAVKKQVAVIVAVFVAAVAFCAAVHQENEVQSAAVFYVGLLGCTLCIIMFGSPLSTIAEVIRTKNSESMPFFLCCLSASTSFLWACFGMSIEDAFVYVPNIVGAVLSSVQLVLLFMYPSDAKATLPHHAH